MSACRSFSIFFYFSFSSVPLSVCIVPSTSLFPLSFSLSVSLTRRRSLLPATIRPTKSMSIENNQPLNIVLISTFAIKSTSKFSPPELWTRFRPNFDVEIEPQPNRFFYSEFCLQIRSKSDQPFFLI